MSDAATVLVVGAGAVGLACATELARAGHTVIVVERHGRPGLEISSRNSEVIHAGLYYPEGSLKARTCVEGRRLLLERCERFRVPHRQIGKLVVATEASEVAALERIRQRAQVNGVEALEVLDPLQVRRREPHVHCAAALFSPGSGILDAHALVDGYQAEFESLGGIVVLHTELRALTRTSLGWSAETIDSDGRVSRLDAELVVNCAGLACDRVAALAGIDLEVAGWRLHPCKGSYFSLAPSLGAVVRHLVYPVPAGGGLGIHVTPDLGGRLRLGPDAHYVDEIDFEVDPDGAQGFADSVARFLPEIRSEHLSPDIAGIRPKLQGPGEEFRDFVVEESSDRGAPGMINLIGIESPGLTASPALALRVLACAENRPA